MSGYCYTTWNWRWVPAPTSLPCGVLLSWNTAHLDVISTCLDTATQHETGGECWPQHLYHVVYFCLETLLILTSSLHVWILLHNMKLEVSAGPTSLQCGVLLSWNTAHLDVISTCLDTATQHETGGECWPQHLYNVVYFCLETLLILTSSLHVWILLHYMKLEVSAGPNISTMWCTFVLKHCSSWCHLYMSGYCYITWNWRWVPAQHLYNVVYFCLETLLILTSSLHVWMLLHNRKLEVSASPSICTMWCTFVLKHCSSWRHLYMSGCCYTTWNWRWVPAPASVQCGVLLSWNTAHLDVISTCLDTATQHETGGECRPQHLYNVVYFCLETLLILTSSLHVWMLLHNMKLEVSAGPSICTMWCTFVLKHCSSWRHLYMSGAAKSQPPKGIGRETSAGIPRWTLEGDWRMTSSVCYD